MLLELILGNLVKMSIFNFKTSKKLFICNLRKVPILALMIAWCATYKMPFDKY